MLLLKWICFICCWGWLISCVDRLSNQQNQIKALCGELDLEPGDSVVAIEGANAIGSGFIKAGIWSEGAWTLLPVSTRSCVQIPQESRGKLLIENRDRNTALMLPIDSLGTGLNRHRLEARTPFSVPFDCPEQGLAADHILQLEKSWKGEPNWRAGISIKATLHNQQQNLLQQLPQMPHLQPDDPPLSFDLAALQAGTYTLHMRVGYLRLGEQEDDLPVVTQGRGCQLELIREIPLPPRIVAPLKTNQVDQTLIYQKAQVPLAIHKPLGTQLEACIEVGPLTLNQDCQPQRCSKDDQFKVESQLTLETPGLWQVHLRVRDAAGHKSSSSCTLVKVSDSAPTFQLQWIPKRLQDVPLLREPVTHLRARVDDLAHAVLSKEELSKNLECRLTFTSSLGSSRPGIYSRCLSGSCEGQNFKDWIPCSPEIEIDLTQEWLRAENSEGSLTLSVRAQDQAGHQHEVRKTLWFSAAAHTSEPLFKSPSEQIDSKVLPLQHATWIVSSKGSVWTWTDGAESPVEDLAVKALIAPYEIYQAHFYADPDGLGVWAIWQAGTDQQIFGRWEQGRWRFSTSAEMPQPSFYCQNLTQTSQGQVICTADDQLALASPSGWIELPKKSINSTPLRCDSYELNPGSYTSTAKGRWYICNRDRLLFQADSSASWSRVSHNGLPAKLGFLAIFADSQERLWSLVRDQSYQARTFYWQDQSWQEVPFEAGQAPHLHFSEDQKGRLWLGPYVFDPERKGWQSSIPQHLELSSELWSDQKGHIWSVLGGRALIRLEPTPMIFSLESLGIKPASALTGISQTSRGLLASFKSTYDGMNVVGENSVRIIRQNPWQDLAIGYQNRPAFGEEWIAMTLQSNQDLLLVRASGEIARIGRDQAWQVESLPDQRPEDLERIEGLRWIKEQTFLISGQRHMWLWNKGGFTQLESNPDAPFLHQDLTLVDGDGNPWAWASGFEVPTQILILDKTQWKPLDAEPIPAPCYRLVTLTQGHMPIIDCDSQIMTLNDKRWVELLLPHPGGSDRLEVIPSQQSHLPYVFYTYHLNEKQYLARYDLQTQQHDKWLLPEEERLFRQDDRIIFGHIAIDEIVVDPSQSERFLAMVKGHILRPEGDRMIVAVSRRFISSQKSITSSPFHYRRWKNIAIGRYGEVWILGEEIGLLRFDDIWLAREPAPKDNW